MEDYINISAFLIGASTAFFALFAIHILFWREERTRFQTVLGIIMAVWAVLNLKDIIITFPGMYKAEVLNWIMIADGWSALTFTVFILETVMPGWTTWKRLFFHSLPFAAFTLLYFVSKQAEWVITGYLIFLWCYAWTVVGFGYIKVKRHIRYVRNNFSNIDNIDVSWLKPVFFFAVVSQLLWLFTSIFSTNITDIAYYVSTIVLWLVVLHYSWNFQPIAEKNDEKDALAALKAAPPIAEGALEAAVEEQQLFLKKDLTISDLAQVLNTNRTYVSNYFGQVRGQTFYDYINQLRVERACIPMMKEHPEYALEYIAGESGFASISTFRRAFTKLTGQTPRQYRINLNKATEHDVFHASML